ncbi:MAG: histidine triad nucleotide-binding protein [Bacillota bacterium]|jgi:histidine triad (HIT) family protein
MTDCLFCKMVNKEIPTDIVYEDEDILAFKDIAPKAPVHILIIPKKHIENVAAASEEDQKVLGKIQIVAQKLAAEFGIADSGYRVLTNSGKDSGQVVFHLHYHLVGGRVLGDIC